MAHHITDLDHTSKDTEVKRHGSDFDTIPVIKVCENIQSGWIHLHIHKPSFSVSDDIVVRQMYTACQKVLPRLKVPSEM